MVEYHYNKTPNQTYSFFYEGKRISLFLPFRNDLIEQTIIVKKTFFEASELNIVRQFIPENTVYVDIGANIGNHLIFFGLFTSSKKIYGFEPNSEIFPILVENVKLNNLEQKTILKQVAIGSEKSKGKLVGSSDKTHIAYTDKGVCVCETGNILPLDLVVEEKIGFMKIDVEGMELDVVKGSLNRISSDKPIIFIESDKIEKVIELLNPKNYYIEKSLANYNYLLLPK
jgi:FkbM family methyltransferase